ncbi:MULTISPECIES: hypothetical protein [Okeania]|uniref:Uncharacterized protein n=1 Tax=Okeania hirsuta TaxID=1458930 RepID=A0A3N6NXJ1_9CYAN|nr:MULTISPECIES: hypothetical protein [Okeania]NES76961.1 hypothetical protein [Okeania sp. SIO1H4]NES90789.1 hypothetical protein [Okeania sp. SIO2B9]NET20613.1 hypothetical protein [Okeania sp. SIO1H5]NET92470.1 hypothetical protein [Okeania sp. SIO1H2]RQH17187.1 hypothetical protein D4Z78_18015 [Okeania hirsuta]
MSNSNVKAKIYVFGAKPKQALLVPEIPIAVRNNCQSGQWVIGDTDYGSKVSMTIIKFSKFFGNLGQTINTLWGQIWFIAESGELPHGVLMVTYIKGRSLNDFNRLIASVQSQGVEPATGIFLPEFVKHSGQKPDENGVVKPINYYSLKWRWQERTDWSIIQQAAAVLSDENNLSRMIDLEGTRKMVCLDNLSAEETANLMVAHTNSEQNYSLSLNVSNDQALPQGNESLAAALSS